MEPWQRCGRGETGRRNGLEPHRVPVGKPAVQNCSNSGKPRSWWSRAKPPEPVPAEGV